MPTPFAISREDILRGRGGQPGWYLLQLKSAATAPGKNDPQSNVTTIEMSVVDGPDKSVIGAPVTHYLSEKNPHWAVSFIEAVTGKRLPETGAAPDLEKAIGRKIKAYMKFDPQFKNWKCEDFLPENGVVAP
jgi:hypothetical protein